MKKFITHIIGTAFLFFNQSATAQSGFYVPKTSKIFFGGDTATIFSNVINDGNFGIGRKAFINFTGNIWENDPQSMISGESYLSPGFTSAAGWVRFHSDSIKQIIKGGYNVATKSGPAFFHIEIQNPSGIELSGSNLKVRKTIKLTQGLFYLHDYVLSVGDNNPGLIYGYDSLHFFVTNNTPRSGYLLRENIIGSDGRIDFPIGSSANAYTPLSIRSNSTKGDDYYVTVFDSVKQNVLSGNSLESKSVNKTWEIGKRFNPGVGEEEIFLQHLIADEGNYFQQNRQNAYVSQFKNGSWDLGSPQTLPSSGYITTGNPLMNSGVNNRIFYNSINRSTFFTKLTGNGEDQLQTKLWLIGWRIDANTVHLNWKTQPETNVQYFIVQRKLSTEIYFKNIDTVLSQVPNGISLLQQIYDDEDANNYTGISFYRLKQVNRGNSFVYSNIIAIGNKAGPFINLLWPNPSPGKFFLSLNPIIPIKKIIVTNVLGQILLEENVNGRTILAMGGKLISGNYFVSLVSAEGAIIETKKLVVIEK
jgi:hypothetical protein